MPHPIECRHSARTGGFRCPICFYDTGKSDEYAAIETWHLPERVVMMVYGTMEPEPITILCCVCEQAYVKQHVTGTMVPGGDPQREAGLQVVDELPSGQL